MATQVLAVVVDAVAGVQQQQQQQRAELPLLLLLVVVAGVKAVEVQVGVAEQRASVQSK